jgi:hypothetical protein
LRSTTSPRLLREPHIGARMVAELRAHCPFRRGRKKNLDTTGALDTRRSLNAPARETDAKTVRTASASIT